MYLMHQFKDFLLVLFSVQCCSADIGCISFHALISSYRTYASPWTTCQHQLFWCSKNSPRPVIRAVIGIPWLEGPHMNYYIQENQKDLHQCSLQALGWQCKNKHKNSQEHKAQEPARTVWKSAMNHIYCQELKNTSRTVHQQFINSIIKNILQ